MTRRRRATALAAALLAVAACGSGGDSSSTTSTGEPISDLTTSSVPAPQGATVCGDAPVPAPAEPGFLKASSAVKAAGTPGHGFTDALSVDGQPAAIAGRLQYGRLNIDLNDERVELWLDDCSAETRLIGEAISDKDGIVELEIPDLDLDPGRYVVHAVVAGDGTFASAVLTVVPRDAEVVIFDIDGTLTVADSELFRDVVGELFPRLVEGDYVPEARAGASEATRSQLADGRLVVYLTGRPVWLSNLTREWLVEHTMAEGVLLMPARDAGAAPNEEGVGATKVAFLQALAASGLRVVDAYGNADTDAYAYRAVGIPDEQIHMLGTEAPPGVDALGEDFEAHNASR